MRMFKRDIGTASPLEKTIRVLTSLSHKENIYLFDDGYPRSELREDAGAALDVVNQLKTDLITLRTTLADLLRSAPVTPEYLAKVVDQTLAKHGL